MGSIESLQNTTSFTLQCRRLITPSRSVGESFGASRPATQMFLSSAADIFCSMHHSKCGAGDICKPCDLLHCSLLPVLSWSHGSSPYPFTLIPPPHSDSGAFPSGGPSNHSNLSCFDTIVSNAVYFISHYFLPSLQGIRIESCDASRIRSAPSPTRPRGRCTFNGTNRSVTVLHCSSITEMPGSIQQLWSIFFMKGWVMHGAHDTVTGNGGWYCAQRRRKKRAGSGEFQSI